MEEPRTTVIYKGVTYPFYKTNRGNVDFENAGFKMSEVVEGKTHALLAMVYYHLRDCAKRAQMVIEDSFEQFIDASDPDITDVFARLFEERQKLFPAETKKPKAGASSQNPGL